MPHRSFRDRLGVLALAMPLFVVLAGACKGESGSASGDPKARAASEAALAKADKADGKEDKVVEKCPVCSLRMNGKKEHRASVYGYEVHMCSADCQKTFTDGPDKVLAGLDKDAAPMK